MSSKAPGREHMTLVWPAFSDKLASQRTWVVDVEVIGPHRFTVRDKAPDDSSAASSLFGSRPRKYAPIVPARVASTTTERISMPTWRIRAKPGSGLKPVSVASAASYGASR
jgi:hypothetical protein